MSGQDDVEDVAAVVTADAVDFRETVDEFCLSLSVRVARPEMVYAFAQGEKRSGCVKDTASAFQSRFDAFMNRPV